MKNKQDIYKITSIVLILDQVIKLLINHYMNLYQTITIIPHFFSIYFTQNTGAAFSILENNTTILIIVSVVFIVLIDRYIQKEISISKLSKISFGLILGGVFGNLLDRIIHHAVIDYLLFTFGSYQFPVFNLADIGITCGVILLIIDTFFGKGENHERVMGRNQKRSKSRNNNNG